MTDLVKEMSLKTIKAVAKNVQGHVEEFKAESLTKSMAETYTTKVQRN